MDAHTIVLTILNVLLACESVRNLLSSMVFAIQVILIWRCLGGYENALRVLRLAKLADTLDELEQQAAREETMPAGSTTPTASSRGYTRLRPSSRVQALSGIYMRSALDDIQKDLHRHGTNPLWCFVYGNKVDALLTGFEAVVTTTTGNAFNSPASDSS
ncbi:unnamed protein product [Calypogeia fissa]